jgi:peptidoglycan-associated lipoprotein
MKKLNLLSVIIAGIALVTLDTGCHRKPSGLTPIPGMEGPQGGGNQGGPPPGLTLPPEQNPGNNNNPTGIVLQPNAIFDGPHTEDAEKFKADTVYFDFDSATVKASEESKLQDVAGYLKGNQNQGLLVQGNCDERGTEKYNLSLGERRALAVREYLANLGVDPQHIRTVTFGKSKPVDPGHNEEAWKKNRRGDLVLVIPK